VDQAKIAIANGGIVGRGPGNSIQRNYLPYAHADFIYAVICEEYGLIGGFILIGIYVLLFFRVTRLVTKSPKAFGAMVALGLALVIVVQAFFHIGINLNVLPVTGLTLPLISMGGTSLLFNCIAFGVILSVSKYIESVTDDVFEEDLEGLEDLNFE
ncbi:MAG: FtsW/RodA/SpoVE family cell cycle protein, partial [Bacteroidota bacterium]